MRLQIAALTALAFASTPAVATTYITAGQTDVVGGDAYFDFPYQYIGAGGHYSLEVRLSRPALSIGAGVEYVSELMIYDGLGGFFSDQIPGFTNIGFGTNGAHFKWSFDTRENYADVVISPEGFPDGISETFFYGLGVMSGSFAADGPVEYVAILVAGVPEPASWAMMIAGFGLVGGSLRSRRRALAG